MWLRGINRGYNKLKNHTRFIVLFLAVFIQTQNNNPISCDVLVINEDYPEGSHCAPIYYKYKTIKIDKRYMKQVQEQQMVIKDHDKRRGLHRHHRRKVRQPCFGKGTQ